MGKINFNKLSNSEIKIKLIELENEYAVCKSKIKATINQMNDLDKEYTLGKEILNKRTGGNIL